MRSDTEVGRTDGASAAGRGRAPSRKLISAKGRVSLRPFDRPVAGGGSLSAGWPWQSAVCRLPLAVRSGLRRQRRGGEGSARCPRVAHRGWRGPGGGEGGGQRGRGNPVSDYSPPRAGAQLPTARGCEKTTTNQAKRNPPNKKGKRVGSVKRASVRVQLARLWGEVGWQGGRSSSLWGFGTGGPALWPVSSPPG